MEWFENNSSAYSTPDMYAQLENRPPDCDDLQINSGLVTIHVDTKASSVTFE